MKRRHALRVAGLLAALLLAGTARAAVRGAGGFDDWLVRGDPAAAEARFRADAERDPSDPWPRLGLALLGERALDDAAEADALLALVAAAPAHPLAPVALRRLGEIQLTSPLLAERVDPALARLLDAGSLRGLAAYRARVARAAAAEVRSRGAAAARLRAENGTVDDWSLAGPFGAYHALDLDRPFPPEQGEWRERWEGAGPGGVPVVSRRMPSPEGALSLDGEPGGEVFYLAADVRLARGGRYLLGLGTTASVRAFVDGVPVAERRAWSGWPSAVQVIPLELAAGSHRLLVKLTRGSARPSLAVALAREDGTPSDARWSAAASGPGPAVRPGTLPAPYLAAPALVAALEPEAGPAVARWVAARDRSETDRQRAVALLEEAVAQAPAAAPLRSARAEALAGDASQAERTARARAEADWREALRIDPADAATRVTLAELLLATERLDDAEALLGGLPERAALRPRARVARARLLLARSFPEEAEALVLGTLRSDETCAAAAMVLETAGRRDAVALQDEAVATLARCAGGAERLAEHRRHRGELAEAARLWTELARAAPARIDARTALARVRVAQGDAAAAASEFEDLARLWPRDPRLQKRLADALDLAGQPRAARAARERALALDGSDLALRRALALEDGAEVLAPLAEDGDEAIRRYQEAGGRSDASASLVLDAAAVEAYPDGSSTERVHQVFHVLDVKGVERWGEVEVPPGAVVLRARTRKQDGRIREAEEHGGDKRTLSASGLEPGDFLEVEWMRGRPSRGPAIPGWTADPFFFRGEDLAFFRSVYAVAAPPGLLEVDAKHMPAPPETRLPDGRVSVRHEARSVPALVAEPGDPSITEFLPMMQVGAGAGLPEAALAAADAFVDRLQPSHDLQALAAEVRRPAGSRVPLAGEALVRAAYDAVLARVEGTGSIVDQASHVLSRGRGSRTLVLLAVLDALGVKARLALARPFPADPAPWRFPRLDLYSAPLVRVEVEGKTIWLDPSLRWTPFGALPDAVRDAEVLVLPRPGEALRVERTPARLPDDRYEVELRIEVDGEGDATVEGYERFTGYDAAAAKVALEQADTAARRRVVEQGLSRSFRALTLESVTFEGERDSSAPLTIRFRARVVGLARKAGGRWIIDAVPYPARLGARYAPLAARETPLLLPGNEQARLRIAVRPPPGATPDPGAPRDVESPQGRYRRTERQEGGALLREDVVEIHRSRVAPDDYPALARFAGEVDEAQAVPMDLGAVTAP